ncbi:AAA family ATPase [Brevibacillus borstelensis]|uniref:AAA family ATPase n=1 Tax=Brevibacillus borstelensis TaxID=45462 RepID=UPI002E1C3B3B|nr:AAA family ATPase [Brevibacillus borstelensis]MED1872046.1 AAA family ATPase [Brevibacillus borstelensis]
MLLKSLKLINFRQFIGEQIIEFATDSTKNVTVVMGENGSGKTTLAQAFTWCLYGDTDFEDKVVANRALEKKLLPGEELQVRVELNLIHNGTEYTITREQLFKKDITGRSKAQNATFNISYKKDGQQEFVRALEVDAYMKQILPKELSRYFFFDGERIGNMSKEIKKGKSQDFAQAVRSLLGLSAFISALDHLKPTSKYGVIGSYNDSYDSNSDRRIAQYTQDIQKAEEEIEKIDKRLTEISAEMEHAQEKCDELNIKLSGMAETERLQKEKQRLSGTLIKTKQARTSAMASILKQFNTNYSSYFSKSLILKSLEGLSEASKLDKGIPDMHARTIEFLIKRGFCVCGTKIEFGKDAYNELNKALEYLPPQSIGMSINQFVVESELKTKSSIDLFESIRDHYKSIRDYDNEIEQLTSDIQAIEKQIEGKEGTGNLQKDLWRYEKIIRDRTTERDELNRKRGAHETTRDRLSTERAELTLRDEKNKKIEIYKAYAQYMYDELSRVYKKNEDETRQKLESYVNEIFKSIYEGGMSINVDERYNIQVIVEDESGYSNDVETSTAQSISVIFAFISGIIKMARENSLERDNETKLLDSEPYPLVMDAPLSAFDRRRIKTVCDALPSIAEQVIIFIKDTDGELAEENMGAKVGKRYLFDKKNEFETYLVAR